MILVATLIMLLKICLEKIVTTATYPCQCSLPLSLHLVPTLRSCDQTYRPSQKNSIIIIVGCWCCSSSRRGSGVNLCHRRLSCGFEWVNEAWHVYKISEMAHQSSTGLPAPPLSPLKPPPVDDQKPHIVARCTLTLS